MSGSLQCKYKLEMCIYRKALSCMVIDTIPPLDATLLSRLAKIHCTTPQEELRYLASLSHAQRRLYEADVKPVVLQRYCRAPPALYEALLAPPLTTHEHHLVREMLLPAGRVSLSIVAPGPHVMAASGIDIVRTASFLPGALQRLLVTPPLSTRSGTCSGRGSCTSIRRRTTSLSCQAACV